MGNIKKYESEYHNIDWITSRKITTLKKFAYDIKDGDIIVLKIGTNKVYGIGFVVGDYEYSDLFSDIDGWDLQHIRRVKWVKTFDNPEEFDTNTLKRGDATQKLTSMEVIEWIKKLNIKEADLSRTLTELPDLATNGENVPKDINEFLFDEGVASNSINKLEEEIGELQRIANWYNRNNLSPSEIETVAYLAVPLLRALGWTPQRMGIEWNKVDIALFNSLPRDNKNLDVVVEAKKKGRSCLTAKSQAERYAKDRPNCNKLIVTDGLRYGVHVKNNNNFSLYSYLNLAELKSEYPIYDCKGAKESLLAMTPEWNQMHS